MFISKRGKLRPHKSNIEIIERTFGCRRFVWNQLLGLHKEQYEKWKGDNTLEKPKLSLTLLNKELNELKITHSWLNEVSAVVLQQSVNDLYSAFQGFFKRGKGYPKFKSKRGIQSFRFSGSRDIHVDHSKIRLPKCNHKSVISKNVILNDPSSYTVIRDRVGDYFISFVDQIEEIEQEPESKGKFVGVDLGIKSLAVIKHVNGKVEEIENPQFYRKAEKRLKTLSRRLSKKQKGSKNRNKARIKLAKHCRKIANQRNDFLHKLSTRLITENQGINIEDLNVKGMVKNHNLAKSIQDASFSILKQQLIYKASRYIKPKVICLVDRFYPSTQICSHCGVKSEVKIKLHVREWTCGHCGTHHDRDINAATNILNEGCRLTTS
ncbi:IS200/IS605 family element RNA-guided endonuclease TnpB [Klebsiella phage phiKp_32]|nr:IS200/IS605 family element RNA-guided endonuclease TnpB [Klebsiella phage phiKp_32]